MSSTGSRYKSRRGHDAVRAWCSRQLDDWAVPHDRLELETSAGPTHAVVAGAGPATVLYLPGTNFNAATSLTLAAHLATKARTIVVDLPGQPGLSDPRRPPGRHLSGYGTWVGDVIAQVSDQPGTGPLVLVGHSLGAAVALAAPVAAVDALVIIDPAGLIRLRVPTAVLATTIRWLMRPDDQRSHALLHHLSTSNAEHERLAEWLTLVAQHTRAVGAPGPLPRAVLTPWTRTPRSILSGQHDCFLPLGKLAAAAKQQLDTDVTVIPHAAHLAVHDDPHSIASAVTNHLTRTTPWPGEPDPGSA